MEMIKSLDKDFLASAFDISYFMKFAYGLDPDPWQVDALEHKGKHQLWDCSRQSGKSRTAGTLAMHFTTFSYNKLTLVVSYRSTQAVETFRKIKEGLDKVKHVYGIVKNNTTTLELSNGSRILCLPASEDNIRSYTADLIILDEASLIADEAYMSLRPMLATTDGTVIALGTPWGQRGWFYKAWTNTEQYEHSIKWKRTLITADDCPRITDEIIQRERLEMGDRWVRQEFFGEFIDSDDQVFSHENVLKCTSTKARLRFITMNVKDAA
jgi:hypothetical protein